MNNKLPPKSGPSVLSFWHVASMSGVGGKIFISLQGGNPVCDFISGSGTGEMPLIL